ncbi:MAG: dihydrodipicolinate synthase family protein [Opitutaceae bacterium]|jgi:4-hydroxy-tetrahydrodipicolinate synthase|nr:dihydrodipicolinate synthase family protein [Opitutaceae bacterium]
MKPTPSQPPPRKRPRQQAAAPRAGILAALWLPMDARGRLLKTALRENINWLREKGIYGILALGSTGEFARLTLAQRLEALEAVAELAPDLPLIANITSIRLDEVVAVGRRAKALGYAGAAIMPPPFYPINPNDMLAFFLAAAGAVKLPFYLYNFPELSGKRIGIEVVRRFAEKADMAGIKQSGGEVEYHKELIALGQKKRFSVFTGQDCRLPEMFAWGADGCIGGLTNIVPDIMIDIYKMCREGRSGDLEKAGRRMGQVGQVAARLNFPLEVMAGMEAMGRPVGAAKQIVSPQTAKLYAQVVAAYKKLFASWKKEDAV